jgi:hypothetical protein
MSTGQDMEKMVARLRSLSEHTTKIVDAQVGQTPKTLVWTKNKAKLYRYERYSHQVEDPASDCLCAGQQAVCPRLASRP